MNTHKHKILFVEDDQIDRIAFERFAKKGPFPYEYVITDSIEKTRKILETDQFDAAVLDYALGEGTAFDIFNDLEGTPIIIVTSAGTAEIAVTAMKKGAYDYLIKDSEGNYLKTLPLTVENAITHKQVEEELRKHRDHLEELVKERTVKLQEEIVERKQVEEALRESEQRYRLLIENIPTVAWMSDQDGKTLFISSNVENVYGYTPDEILEKGKELWFGRIHPDDKDRVKKMFNLLFSEQRPFDVEYRIQRKDGEWIWLHDQASTVEKKAGQLYAYGVFSDITEHKQVEKALWTSEEKYRTLFETANDAIFVLKDKKFVDCNKKTLEIFGGTREQIVDHTPYELSPPTQPDGRNSEEKALEKINAVLSDKPQFFEWTHSKCDGTLFSTEVSLSRLEIGDEHYILAVVRDISERKQAEEELRKYREHLEELVEERTAELQILNENLKREIYERRQAEEALAEERNLLRTLIDNLPDYIYVKDRESRFLLANKASIQGLGITTVDELVGKTDFDFFPVEFSEQYHADEQTILESGQPLINREEWNIDLATGDTNWVLTTKVPLRDSQGYIVGIVGIGRNITDRKRMDKVLQKAKEVAEEAQQTAEAANQAKSRFLANMSHELRTPLNAILGFTQLMERDSAFPNKHKEHLGVISRSGKHLLELINDVLDLSKIEAGQSPLVKTTFDLYYMLQSLEEMIRIRADKKDLQLTFECLPDVPQYIKTDERKLRQILINLLDNAVKFTKEGSVTLKIENCRLNIENLREEKSNCQSSIVNLQFSIEDTGPGIAPEEMDKLFEAFTQTESGQKAEEGTGLGLTLSHQFVQLLEGDIRVSSQVGQGTNFTFDIRVEVVEASEAQLQQPTRRIIGLQPDQPSYRILIVDDHVETRMLLRILLEEVGFSVQEASNGKQAIELYENWQPYLIWMDLRMPVMDGYEATKQIRELERQKAKGKRQKEDSLRPSPFALHPVPIIALTSSAFEENRATVLATGCDDFLRKPFQESEIFDLLHKHLGVRYVYDNGEGQKTKDKKQFPKNALTPAALVVLPSDVVANLEYAVSRSDMELINSIIDEIRHHDTAVADALTYLANEFDYDEIFRIIQKGKEL